MIDRIRKWIADSTDNLVESKSLIKDALIPVPEDLRQDEDFLRTAQAIFQSRWDVKYVHFERIDEHNIGLKVKWDYEAICESQARHYHPEIRLA